MFLPHIKMHSSLKIIPWIHRIMFMHPHHSSILLFPSSPPLIASQPLARLLLTHPLPPLLYHDPPKPSYPTSHRMESLSWWFLVLERYIILICCYRIQMIFLYLFDLLNQALRGVLQNKPIHQKISSKEYFDA